MPSIYLVCDGVYGPRGTRTSRELCRTSKTDQCETPSSTLGNRFDNFGAIVGVSRGHAESIDNFTWGIDVYRRVIGVNHMVAALSTEFSRRVLELGEAGRARQAIEAAKSVLDLTESVLRTGGLEG